MTSHASSLVVGGLFPSWMFMFLLCFFFLCGCGGFRVFHLLGCFLLCFFFVVSFFKMGQSLGNLTNWVTCIHESDICAVDK